MQQENIQKSNNEEIKFTKKLILLEIKHYEADREIKFGTK